MTHPSWKPENIRRRVARARHFPDNTCPSSRHVQMMAEYLLSDGYYTMLLDEPEHCAVSMLVTVEMLYKARTEIKRLRAAMTTKLPPPRDQPAAEQHQQHDADAAEQERGL
jgi:hypothetical protein